MTSNENMSNEITQNEYRTIFGALLGEQFAMFQRAVNYENEKGMWEV